MLKPLFQIFKKKSPITRKVATCTGSMSSSLSSKEALVLMLPNSLAMPQGQSNTGCNASSPMDLTDLKINNTPVHNPGYLPLNLLNCEPSLFALRENLGMTRISGLAFCSPITLKRIMALILMSDNAKEFFTNSALPFSDHGVKPTKLTRPNRRSLKKVPGTYGRPEYPGLV
jgi:hypothetical protein